MNNTRDIYVSYFSFYYFLAGPGVFLGSSSRRRVSIIHKNLDHSKVNVKRQKTKQNKKHKHKQNFAKMLLKFVLIVMSDALSYRVQEQRSIGIG